MQPAGSLSFITPYHFELLLESSRPGLYKEIDSFHYGRQPPVMASSLSDNGQNGQNGSGENSGEVRLLVIAALKKGPQDFVFLHLHADITKGEIVTFKAEKIAKHYFNKEKRRLKLLYNIY